MSNNLKTRNSFKSALPWVGSSIFLILLVVVWPAIELIRISFSKINDAGQIGGYHGLENYKDLISNGEVAPILIRTFFWVFTVVLVTVLISLPLAQLINQKFPGRKYVRWALIVPWAASVVMTSTVWQWILDLTAGELNLTLQELGIQEEPVDWLGDPRFSFWVLIWIAIFVSVPFTTFVLLAGLQSIPNDILEAASVDGATSWTTYRKIKFPLLRNSLLIATIINLINVFNSFPIIYALTRGGPGYDTSTTTVYAYKLAFTEFNMGQSTAMGTINFIIILIIVSIYLKITKATRMEL